MFDYWLPQKGLTLFPHANKNPPTVRVKGINLNTPEGRAVLFDILPGAKEFYMRQAHQFSLSLIDQYQSQVRTEAGDKIRVLFSAGQEHVFIEAAPRPAGLTDTDVVPTGIVGVPRVGATVWGAPYTDDNRPYGTEGGTSPYVIIDGGALYKEQTQHTGQPESLTTPEAYGTTGAWHRVGTGFSLSWEGGVVFARGKALVKVDETIIAAATVDGLPYVLTTPGLGDPDYYKKVRVLAGFPASSNREDGDTAVSVEGEDYYVVGAYTGTYTLPFHLDASLDTTQCLQSVRISPGGSRVVIVHKAEVFRLALAVTGSGVVTCEHSSETYEPASEELSVTYDAGGLPVPPPEAERPDPVTAADTYDYDSIEAVQAMEVLKDTRQVGVVWEGETELPVMLHREFSMGYTNLVTPVVWSWADWAAPGDNIPAPELAPWRFPYYGYPDYIPEEEAESTYFYEERLEVPGRADIVLRKDTQTRVHRASHFGGRCFDGLPNTSTDDIPGVGTGGVFGLDSSELSHVGLETRARVVLADDMSYVEVYTDTTEYTYDVTKPQQDATATPAERDAAIEYDIRIWSTSSRTTTLDGVTTTVVDADLEVTEDTRYLPFLSTGSRFQGGTSHVYLVGGEASPPRSTYTEWRRKLWVHVPVTFTNTGDFTTDVTFTDSPENPKYNALDLDFTQFGAFYVYGAGAEQSIWTASAKGTRLIFTRQGVRLRGELLTEEDPEYVEILNVGTAEHFYYYPGVQLGYASGLVSEITRYEQYITGKDDPLAYLLLAPFILDADDLAIMELDDLSIL